MVARRRPATLKRLADDFSALRHTYRHKWLELKVDLVAEAAVRLEQCDLCLRKVRALERRYRASMRQMPQRPGHRRPTESEWAVIRRLHVRQRAITEEIWVWSEAFYHCAWRVRGLVRHRDCLAWISFEVQSIRTVRNQLMVHPEDHGGVVGLTFAHDLPEGPVLKPFGAGKRPTTAGLFVHAKEFVIALARRLDQSGL
jgi:hypothetical protein